MDCIALTAAIVRLRRIGVSSKPAREESFQKVPNFVFIWFYKGILYLSFSLIPFTVAIVFLCVLMRRRVLQRRLNALNTNNANNMEFSRTNPRVYVSQLPLYPNQLFPNPNQSDIGQLPPSYDTIIKKIHETQTSTKESETQTPSGTVATVNETDTVTLKKQDINT